MSFRILLVDPDSTIVSVTESALAKAGHRVAWVSTFEEAKLQLSLDAPDLLVTAVRLAAFNGVQLLFRCQAEHPEVPVIVAGSLADLTADMRRYASRFVTTPIDRDAFVELVSELLTGHTPHDPHSARRWPRKRTELPATVQRNAARVVELSYGGLRLEMADAPEDVRALVEIVLPSLGLSVQAIPRWTKPVEEGGAWWCGAEVALDGSDAARHWHYIVDSIH